MAATPDNASDDRADGRGQPVQGGVSVEEGAGAGSAVPAPERDDRVLPAADEPARWVFPMAQTVVAMHRRLQSEYTGAGREQRLDPFKVCALLFEVQSIAYIADRRADAPALAACLMAACLRLRLSPVGNRRLGFALAMLFLRLNGIEFTARAEEKFTFAARFGYLGFESNVFADWIRLRLIAQRTGAGTVVRVRTRGRRIEGVSMLRTGNAQATAAAKTSDQALPLEPAPALPVPSKP